MVSKALKRPTSGGQARDQEAAVQWTSHLERSSFLFLSTLMVQGLKVAFTSLYYAHSCAKHRPQLLPSGSEATPHENHLYIHVGLPIDEGAVVHLFFFYLPQVALDKLYHFATSHVFESEVAGRMCSDMCGAAAKVRTCLLLVCVCCVCLKPGQSACSRILACMAYKLTVYTRAMSG